ncbi:5-deoxy-glucuronate isomerase [Nesterenkonia pannonica]|uniref:5-deoxy-glucuronate isomerase n=1 Tax=Nesterenkonia pannonica TaxID=1548602 RepID=UPI002164EF55|nr:5-deoxy-glucuronate isomerase [Nesterenkonia pannonica]
MGAPSGTASTADWTVDVGTPDSEVQPPGWTHTGLRVTGLAAGASVRLAAQPEERIIIPLSGSFEVRIDGDTYALGGRPSVFHGPSDVLYTGIETAITLSSERGGRVAVASAPASAHHPIRHIAREEVPVELRGVSVASRQVHNFGTPAVLEADRFIVCEVLTPAGNWSSYPPHKHDEEKEGETSLEEIYYFEMQPTEGAPCPLRQTADPM